MSDKYKYYLAYRNQKNEFDLFGPYDSKGKLNPLTLNPDYIDDATERRFIEISPNQASYELYKAIAPLEVFETSGQLTQQQKDLDWQNFLKTVKKIKTPKQIMQEKLHLKYFPLSVLLKRKLEKEVFLIQSEN